MQATVGSHCVECAKASRPTVSTRARFWSARQPILVTLSLIAVNVLVFLATVVQNPRSISGYLTQLHLDLLLNERAIEVTGEWYRLVTSGFLHYGIVHLGFNMYLLYILGQMLEPALGRVRFGLVYLASLLGGSAGVLLLQPDGLTAGASGAVFGLMGCAFVGYWQAGTNPFSTSIGGLLMINLVLTFVLSDRISVGGHLGGAVAGALCGLAVMAPPWKGVPDVVRTLVPLSVAAVSLAVSVVMVG